MQNPTELRFARQAVAKAPSWGGIADTMQMNPFEASVTKPTDAGLSPWAEQVAVRPRVFYFHNFLTDAERAHMVRLAAPMMKRSLVSGANGEGIVDSIRTSYGMFIRRLQDPIIERIQQRISMATHMPVSHQEDIQVLRYTKGQSYGAHYDSAYDTKESGPHFRMATFYMYLSDVEEGGETAFPEKSVWADLEAGAKADASFSACAKGHVAAKPKAGDAVLFYSFFPNKTMDPASLHTGCPVIKGIKWGAPVWIHVDEFKPDEYKAASLSRPEFEPGEFKKTLAINVPPEPGLCLDYDTRCKEWAVGGECTANPYFMVGKGSGGVGICRQACKFCKLCKEDDWACIAANRKAEGYLEVTKDEMEWLGVPWWMCSEASQKK